jgi:hypothetical protein
MNKRVGKAGFLSIEAIISVIVLVLLFNYLKNEPNVQTFWTSFNDNMQKIHDGQPHEWQTAAPVMSDDFMDIVNNRSKQ